MTQKETNSMTQYKVNKWYPHAMLKECPVHPESKVSTTRLMGAYNTTHSSTLAGNIDWEDVAAFKVVEEYQEPLVLWVNVYDNFNAPHSSEKDAVKYVRDRCIRTVKMIEVKE